MTVVINLLLKSCPPKHGRWPVISSYRTRFIDQRATQNLIELQVEERRVVSLRQPFTDTSQAASEAKHGYCLGRYEILFGLIHDILQPIHDPRPRGLHLNNASEQWMEASEVRKNGGALRPFS